MCNGCIIIGDMNARLGEIVREILPFVQVKDTHPYSYPQINDPVYVVNDNVEILTSICTDNNLLVLNNLKTFNNHFELQNVPQK